MPAPLAPWTQERVTVLLHLWDVSGESAGDIANHLGGTTRNAVIGKLYRMGKLGTGRPRAKPRQHPRIRSPRAKTSPRRLPILRRPDRTPVTIPAAPVVVEESGKPRVASVLSLHEGHCRWPLGDPKEAGFGFCGAPTPGTYCLHHDRVAHN